MTHPPTESVQSSEPRETQESRTAVPIWLIVLMFLLLYWGALYFDEHGGWFNAQVYRPYRSVEQVASMRISNGGIEDVLQRGKTIFTICAACHKEDGSGNPANGCPPLVDSEWVTTPGPGRIVRIVSKGLTGPVHVKGQVWQTGTMLAIGDSLLGDEEKKTEDIAAVVTYVRYTFGKISVPVTAQQVKAIREEIKGRNINFQEQELLAIPADK